MSGYHFAYHLEQANTRLHKMGLSRDDNDQQDSKRGGTKAALFVYVAVGLENMAFLANASGFVNYFYQYMNFSLTKSSTTLTNYMGSAFILSLVGGLVSDTYLSRFKTGMLFACFELLGFGVLTAQAYFDQLRPTPCIGVAPDQAYLCEKATTGQVAILYVGLYLVALGTGGLKAALPSLGADQFDDHTPEEAAKLAIFFNRYLLSFTIGGIFGVTFLVWISENKGWPWGFGICTMSIFICMAILFMGKSTYRHNVPKGSPLTRIAQVFVVAIKNAKQAVPEKIEEFHEVNHIEAGEENEILEKTEQFRFLDRAAIVRKSNDTTSIAPAGPWKLCTVTQVEETKIIVRMLPIILSTVFLNTCFSQLQTFSVNQGNTMDRDLFGFEVPASSIPVIPLISTFIVIPIYEKIIVPIARKYTGVPTGIRSLQRIGVGLVLSAISMGVAGIIETRRKNIAIEKNMVNSNEALPYSVFWLAFQYAIFGAADMFSLVGLLDFFYSESSSGMRSFGTAISWCSLGLGYFVSTIMVDIVNTASGGWLASNNLNRNKLNYFYWLLAGISLLNFGFYLVCASWYKYKKVDEHYKNQKANALHGRMASPPRY
ncbi:hypothetical protein ACFE04_004499 [Oxalis oulophora]